ncbi:peptidase M23B [Caballeronia fortuita]|uniref:Peptidase M23B n=1 Tax=Caballeronia fortuita TaxID=1777138 RepID=A0A158DQ12_9BURK|nr:M23 family metallopeptidase [Caballeronia fortuita]SAK96500.1 peptidase M23B [Caballeronia fortuita]
MDWYNSHPKNDLYIVMQRGALRGIVRTACAAVVLSLAAGLALGHYGTQTLHVHPEPATTSAVLSPAPADATGDIARLEAANASLDARVGQLAAQLNSLSAFDQRLRKQSPRATATSAVTAERTAYSNAAGGPELPPRSCRTSDTRSDARVARGELDCLSSTLAALERGVAQREAAWEAFPGRRPIGLGRTSSSFGNRRDPFTQHMSFHPGIDLVAPTGTPVLATAAGRVIHAGPMPGYGNTVEIDHGNGFITRYAHASKINVHVGQQVQPGATIAEVGSTGRSTGPHLHFEVRVAGKPVDPADYLALFASASDA